MQTYEYWLLFFVGAAAVLTGAALLGLSRRKVACIGASVALGAVAIAIETALGGPDSAGVAFGAGAGGILGYALLKLLL